jgi:hypothetical protein
MRLMIPQIGPVVKPLRVGGRGYPVHMIKLTEARESHALQVGIRTRRDRRTWLSAKAVASVILPFL